MGGVEAKKLDQSSSGSHAPAWEPTLYDSGTVCIPTRERGNEVNVFYFGIGSIGFDDRRSAKALSNFTFI